MMEFVQENLFFIVVALLMIGCHMLHPHHGHGGHGKKGSENGGDEK